jgi:hypothetical protein
VPSSLLLLLLLLLPHDKGPLMVGGVEAHEVSSLPDTHPPCNYKDGVYEDTTRSSFIHALIHPYQLLVPLLLVLLLLP